MAAPRVAVAGGGLAGLAAATDLKNAGYTVELFERSRLLGGRATSFEMDGIEVDNGQHVFLQCCTEFIAFVERLGMADALYLQDRFDVTVYARGVVSRVRAFDLPAPWHVIGGFLFYRHLSVAGKLQLLKALRSIQKNGGGIRTGSFAEWLQAHGQQDEVLRAFWVPFMVPALNAPLEQMNAAEAASVIATAFLHDRNAARFGYSTVPLAHIMERAAARLDTVHRSKPVTSVKPQNGSVRVQTQDGEEHHFDAIVLALPPRAIARVLGDPQRFGISSLEGFESAAIMDTHLWHDRGRLDFDFAALLDSPVQWVFQKGDGYLCCSMSAAGDLVARPTGEIVERVWRDVRAALPQLKNATLVRGATTRNPEGTYSPKPGVTPPGPRTNSAAIAIAGSWTATGWPDTMESAVRSGRAAAEALIG